MDTVSDPLFPHATRIIDHMNDDHADALVQFCRVFGGRPHAIEARMTGIDRQGFEMLATDRPGGEQTAVRLPFARPVDTADEARKAMIALLQEARAGSSSSRPVPHPGQRQTDVPLVAI